MNNKLIHFFLLPVYSLVLCAIVAQFSATVVTGILIACGSIGVLGGCAVLLFRKG